MRSLSDAYTSYRDKIDVRKVLEHYQAENISESIGSDGRTWIRHSCLLDRVEPHHSNGDANPSAQICLETGHYVCFAYWSGDVIHLLLKLEGREELSELGDQIGNYVIGGTRDVAAVRNEIKKLLDEPVYSVDIPSYSERVLDPWRKSHPYMREVRGIGHETCEILGIGYDAQSNRIVFPHWWEGNLVGWQRRAIPVDDRWPGTVPSYPKYKNSTGFPKSETLYRYHTLYSVLPAIVVESPMSVAKAYEFGVNGTMATFGAKVSQAQIDLLKRFDQVYVWFDDDPAGHAGERKLVEGLYRHTNVLVVEPDKDKDLGDYSSAEQVDSKLEAAKLAAQWLGEHNGARSHRGL